MREPWFRRPYMLVCAAVAVALSGCAGRSDRFPYSGTLQSDSAAIGSTLGGRVVAVLASDGDRVRAGQIIVRLDDRDARAAVDLASAHESQARASLNDLVAGPRQADINRAEAAVGQADAALRRAQLIAPQQVATASQAVREAQANVRSARAAEERSAADYERARRLYEEGAIAAQAMDAARTAALSASAAVVAANARLRAALAEFESIRSGAAAADVAAAQNAAAAEEANLASVRSGARPDQIIQARAALAAAGADLTAARVRLDECSVKAPADGLVDGLDLHPGDLVASNATVATIDEFGDPWVRIYVAQSDLRSFGVGRAVDVRSDAAAGSTFKGRVEAIDATAQFTPRDVETASDRADLSFGVKVRIHDPDRALRSGTTVEVALP